MRAEADTCPLVGRLEADDGDGDVGLAGVRKQGTREREGAGLQAGDLR